MIAGYGNYGGYRPGGYYGGGYPGYSGGYGGNLVDYLIISWTF